MKRHSFRSLRWVASSVQAVLIIGLPFLRIRNESALRFDVPTLKLYFFGSVLWISEAFFLLLVFLLAAAAIMLFTVLYGRIWCGWVCPQTVLSDFARAIERLSAWMSRHRFVRIALSHGLMLLFSGFVSATLIWYFVSPYDMVRDLVRGSLGPWTFWSWAFFSSLAYLNIAIVRQKFCGTVCPYARFQSAFFDDNTLTIAFDRSRADECKGCEACVRRCPSDVDIRDGLQIECINCAECIDACSDRMSAPAGEPLIGYVRGSAGTGGNRGLRPRVLGLAALFGALAVLLVHQIAMRIPVDFWVVRDAGQAHHQQGVRNSMMNAYTLTIENRSLRAGVYGLSVEGIKNAELVVSSNPVILPPNSAVRMRVYVFAERRFIEYRLTKLRFTLQHAASGEIRIVHEAPFIYSDRSERGVDI